SQQLTRRHSRDGFLGGIGEHRVVGHGVAEAAQQRAKLRPAIRHPRQEARRFRQHLQEHRRHHQRQNAADEEERAPAEARKHQPADEAGERSAERNADDRQRHGKYSDESAAAFGIAPPRPRPAKNRSSVRTPTPPATETSKVSRPNVMTLPSSAIRRPRRSPSTPPTAPPIIMPTRPAVCTGTNAGRGRFHSRISAGTAAPRSWLSRPSRMIVIAVPATSSF